MAPSPVPGLDLQFGTRARSEVSRFSSLGPGQGHHLRLCCGWQVGGHGGILSRALECLISTGTTWNLIYSGGFYEKFQVQSSVKPEVSLHVLLSLQRLGGLREIFLL